MQTPELDLNMLTHEAWKHREQDRVSARAFSNQVISATQNPVLQAQAEITLAYILWREGHLAEALENIQKSLTVIQNHNLLAWLPRALNVKNCLGLELGEFAECVPRLEEQLALSRAVGDTEMEACAIHDLGVMHLEREIEKAEPFLQKAMELFGQIDHKDGYGYTLLNLAFVREAQGDLKASFQLLNQVQELATNHHLEQLATYALAQQGRLTFKEGQFEKASDLFIKALERAETMGDRPLAEVMPSLVSCYQQLGRLNEARAILEKHLQTVLRSGFLPFAAQAHELLSTILEAQGDVSGALKHQREHTRLYRRVYSDEHEDKVRALEVLYRTRLAEQRAAAEQRRSRELSFALNRLEHLNQQSLEASFTDELTGLRNRRYLKHCADLEGYSLAMIDLDHFKRINDTYGHDAGDLILKEFAEFLQTHIREQDIPIRFGGEEFIVLFPDTSPAQAQIMLGRLLSRMGDYPWSPFKPGDCLSFTAGVAQCSQSLKDTLQMADMLLYQGKHEGRNGIWLHENVAYEPDVSL